MADLPVIDDPHSAHIFADDAMGFFVTHGTVRITFSVSRPSQPAPGELSHVVIGTLVMPVNGAQRLALGLFDFLKKQGFDPTQVLGGDAQTPQ